MTLPAMTLSSATNDARAVRADDDATAGQALADVVVASPSRRSVMPRGRNAPNDWPADPVNVMSIVPSGRPLAP